MKRPTISDIAAECGVSLSTVSLVLNNNPRISEATREKVWKAVEKFSYYPNVQARGLAMCASQVLSVVVPNLRHVFSDIYFGEIISGIYDAATQANCKVILDIANEKFVERHEHMSLLKSRRVDGMLFIASSVEHEYLFDFEKTSYPFMLVNHYFPGHSLNYIVFDYNQSGRISAEHLLGLGHRSIGIITGLNTYTGRSLSESFRTTCIGAGLSEKDLPLTDCGPEWSEGAGEEAARRLVEANPSITALMCGNDRMAIGALRYLHTRGIRVPEQMSVIGMDDIPRATYTTPGLTTIHHSLYEIGRLACERLLSLFRGEIKTCSEVLPVNLVVRESTATPASR
ncbi:MAG TPA: LacI family DNA-binding transcriptional regulator [Kiritimatiellia bacterium]|nr:LacI family DNA-binding transcriptional regulator [Kiritimatiellia bacterium]HPA77315.1 LacI family DNA-binding transcriptional regulator [Kiritimatiellia bacterium]